MTKKLPPQPRLRIPKSILRRGVKWHHIGYSRGSGQYPGGNPEFTGAQPPCLWIRCEDGTTQHLYLDLPEELVKEDCYVRELRYGRCECCGREEP